MIRRVKLQGTTYTWIDSLAVEQAIVPPRRFTAIHYGVSLVAFALFITALTIVVIEDTRVSQAHLVRSGVGRALHRYEELREAADVAAYVQNVVGPLVAWPGTEAARGGHNDDLPTALGAHVLVGAIRVVQHRVERSSDTCTDPILGAGVRCAPDFTERQRELEARPGAAAFIGPRTLVEFPYVVERFPCPTGLRCHSGTVSRLRPDTIFYPDSGYTVDLYDGGYWVNGTRRTVPVSDLLLDFIDPQTRHIRVTAVFFNAQLNLFTQANIHFELPVTGGVFPFSTYQFLALIDRSRQTLYAAAEVYLWAAVAWTTVFELYHIIQGCRRRGLCLRCMIRGKPTTVTRCQRCSKPIPTTFTQPEECSWCTHTMPEIGHSCWRARLLNPWVLATLGCNLLYIVARVITLGARSEAIELVRAASVAAAAHEAASRQAGHAVALPSEATVLFAPVAQIAAVANDFLAAALVVAFVRTYRYIGRFGWARKYLRVFSSGGFLIASFFFTFAIVFAGFAISFHLLLGEVSDFFVSLNAAMRTTFWALIMVIDWADLRPNNAAGWIFVVVYVAFVFSCALVMLNTLISIVTYEYKLSVQRRTTDVESQSVHLLLKPLLSRLSGGPRGQDTGDRPTHGGGDDDRTSKGQGSDERRDAHEISSSDAPEQAGAGRKTIVDDDPSEGAALAANVEKDDVTAALVTDALRNVHGLSEVIDAATSLEALHADIDELRRELRQAVGFAKRVATDRPRQQAARPALSAEERASLLGYDSAMPYVGL